MQHRRDIQAAGAVCANRLGSAFSNMAKPLNYPCHHCCPSQTTLFSDTFSLVGLLFEALSQARPRQPDETSPDPSCQESCRKQRKSFLLKITSHICSA